MQVKSQITADRSTMAAEINARFTMDDRVTVQVDGIRAEVYTFTDATAVSVYLGTPGGGQLTMDTETFHAAMLAGKVNKLDTVTVPLSDLTGSGILRALSGKPAKVKAAPVVHLLVKMGKSACGRVVTSASVKTAEVTCKRCRATSRFDSAEFHERDRAGRDAFARHGFTPGVCVRYRGTDPARQGIHGVVHSTGSIGVIGTWKHVARTSGMSYGDPADMARDWQIMTAGDLVTVGDLVTYLGSDYRVMSVEASSATLRKQNVFPHVIDETLTPTEIASALDRDYLVIKTPAVAPGEFASSWGLGYSRDGLPYLPNVADNTPGFLARERMRIEAEAAEAARVAEAAPVEVEADDQAEAEAAPVGTFQGKTAEGWRDQARESMKRREESWERSDTDGFLSQAASQAMAREYELCALIAEAGGVWQFPALFDLKGQLISIKARDGQYGEFWINQGPAGNTCASRYITRSNARKGATRLRNDEKKGFRVGLVSAVPLVKLSASWSAYAYIPNDDDLSSVTVIDNGTGDTSEAYSRDW